MVEGDLIEADASDLHDNASIDCYDNSRVKFSDNSPSNFRQSLIKLRKGWNSTGITVEIVAFFYMFCYIATAPILQNLIILKVADVMNVTFNETEGCDSAIINNGSSNSTDDPSLAVSAEAAQWMITFQLAYILPSLITTLFLGSVSDKRGRKPLIILPLFFGLLKFLSYVIIAYFQLPLWMFVICNIFEGFTGGVGLFLTTCFSYIADITTFQNRPMRIVILEIAMVIGSTVGSLSSGYFLTYVGYQNSFVTVLCILFVPLVYAIVFLTETVNIDYTAKLITLDNFKPTWKVFYKDNGYKRMWKLQAILLIQGMCSVVDLGTMDVSLLYLEAAPTCLSTVKYGYFQAEQIIISSFGCILLTKLLTKRLSPPGFVVISCTSSILLNLGLAFTTSETIAFIVPLGGIFSTLAVPMLRSTASRLVEPYEQGAMFSGITMVQLTSIMIGGIVFKDIYSATIYIYHGLMYLCTAGFYIITLVVAIVFYLLMKRDNSLNNAALHVNQTDTDEEHA